MPDEAEPDDAPEDDVATLVQRPSLAASQTMSAVWSPSACETSSHVVGTPIGQSESVQRHSRSRRAPGWMRKPQPGSAVWSTVTLGQRLMPRQRVTPDWGSVLQSMPVGVALEEPELAEPLLAPLVESLVPSPVSTFWRHAPDASARARSDVAKGKEARSGADGRRAMPVAMREHRPTRQVFGECATVRPLMADFPLAARPPRALASHDATRITAALTGLTALLAEDAIFVLGAGVRDLKEALEGMLQRRAASYAAAVEGKPHTRMTGAFDAWYVDMVRALAPISPPAWVPMMDVVREKVTLEIGARGLRSLFSSKPSDKDVARVKRYGSLAARTLRAVLSADGNLDAEDLRSIAALVAALGLPEADANTLRAEPAVAPETMDVYGEIDHAVARAILRGGWLAAASDGIDPREENVLRVVGQKFSLDAGEIEQGRRDAIEAVDWRRKVGIAAIDGVRFVLSDRVPGLGVQLAALTGTVMLPRRWRDEALSPVGQGAPVTLAKRHVGLEAADRRTILAIAWAAALAEDPSLGRRAVLRVRWEKFAEDLGEDDPEPLEVVERWLTDALADMARKPE